MGGGPPLADVRGARAPGRVPPDDGKPHLEHSGAKVVRLATELLAELTHLHDYGYMAADDLSDAALGLENLVNSGRPDEISGEAAFNSLRAWCTGTLDRWQDDWDNTGRDECAAGGQNPPRYFRE